MWGNHRKMIIDRRVLTKAGKGLHWDKECGRLPRNHVSQKLPPRGLSLRGTASFGQPWLSSKSQLPAWDKETVVTPAAALSLCPQAGTADVRGRRQYWGAASPGTGRVARGWPAGVSTLLTPKAYAFITSAQRRQPPRFHCGYGWGDYGRAGGQSKPVTSTPITLVPGMWVWWQVWPWFWQSCHYSEWNKGTTVQEAMKPAWPLYLLSLAFLFLGLVKEMYFARYKRKLLETTGTLWVQCLHNLTLSSREKWKGGRRKGKQETGKCWGRSRAGESTQGGEGGDLLP